MVFREHFSVPLKPSKVHYHTLCAAHVFVFGLVLWASMPLLETLLAVGIVMLSFFWHIRRYRHNACFTLLEFNSLGIRLVAPRRGIDTESLLEKQLYLSSRLIIIHYRDQHDRVRSLLIFKDALAKSDFRHVYVLLKTRAYAFMNDNSEIDC